MRRHRTTARGILAFLLLPVLAAAALATPASSGQGVPRLVFPLVATTQLWDNYGDPRGNGRHAGIDMENPWRAPVVAVEDGRVEYGVSRLGGCMLYLYGRSGTMYLYIHLNNDLTPRNDNRGRCRKGIAFAVSNRAKVTAGQQIAWNGDSGDADGNPHLHFEVHPRGGADVNSFPHLRRAVHPLFAAKRGSVFSLGLRGRLVTVSSDAVSLQVERVRQYPGGGHWLAIDRRTVHLSVPLGAEVAPSLARISGPSPQTLRVPRPVSVFTLKATATPEAIVGSAGALQVGRLKPIP